MEMTLAFSVGSLPQELRTALRESFGGAGECNKDRLEMMPDLKALVVKTAEQFSGAEKSYGVHGWASTYEIWETKRALCFLGKFLMAGGAGKEKDRKTQVAILPTVLVNSRQHEEDGEKRIYPSDAAEQMFGLMGMFGWEGPIYILGHSTGAAALFHLASMVLERKVLTADRRIPDLRLILSGPACPAKANIFEIISRPGLGVFLKYARDFAKNRFARRAVDAIADFSLSACTAFWLPDQDDDLKKISVKTVSKYLDESIAVQNGLYAQPDLTQEQMREIFDKFRTIIQRDGNDRIVDARISAEMTGQIIENLIREGYSGMLPLELMTWGTDHYGYGAGMGDEAYVLETVSAYRIDSPAVVFRRMLEKVPREEWPAFLLSLRNGLNQIAETMSEGGSAEIGLREELAEQKAIVLAEDCGVSAKIFVDSLKEVFTYWPRLIWRKGKEKSKRTSFTEKEKREMRGSRKWIGGN